MCRRAPSLAVLLVLSLTGCGGGGGSSPETLAIPATPSLTGYTDPNGVSFLTGETYLFVGDVYSALYGETGVRGFVSFDLSRVPASAQLISATLRMDQHGVNDPLVYPSLGSIVLDQTVYGDVLEPGAYGRSFPANQGFAVLSSDASLGPKEADVTVAVAADRAALRTRSQFRIRFEVETNGNNEGEVALLGADGVPGDAILKPGWPLLILTFQP